MSGTRLQKASLVLCDLEEDPEFKAFSEAGPIRNSTSFADRCKAYG
jgi:hypothetical protein